MTLREEFEKETGEKALILICDEPVEYSGHYVQWLEEKIQHKQMPQKTKDSLALLRNMVYDHASEPTKKAFEHIEKELQYLTDHPELVGKMGKFEYVQMAIDCLKAMSQSYLVEKATRYLERAME